MKFINSEEPLTTEKIAAFERELGLHFPPGLRGHYLRANGGSPERDVYEDENVDTMIQKCLPLRHGKGSAIRTYEVLVLSKGLVPKHFFPFACDPGGDYFYVDCSSTRGMVYLYRHDTAFEPLVDLHVSIDDFWSRLKADDDAS
jgi:SMI1-KNR4 cell-wall